MCVFCLLLEFVRARVSVCARCVLFCFGRVFSGLFRRFRERCRRRPTSHMVNRHQSRKSFFLCFLSLLKLFFSASLLPNSHFRSCSCSRGESRVKESSLLQRWRKHAVDLFCFHRGKEGSSIALVVVDDVFFWGGVVSWFSSRIWLRFGSSVLESWIEKGGYLGFSARLF